MYYELGWYSGDYRFLKLFIVMKSFKSNRVNFYFT